MCGIFGIVGAQRAGVSDAGVRRALDALSRRGPDDHGWYADESVVLGHTRLSIMDLSEAGHQPMSNEDGSVQVVFNGEIYGFGALRRELEALGHRFRSRSDTEVLVHGYEAWGRGLLERVRGMFAFALWDARERALLLARDPLGKKPLFVVEGGGSLAFASLLRPLVEAGLAAPRVDPRALREFLFFNYVPGPRTILRDVELLPAGSWLEYRAGRTTRGRYWELGDARAQCDLATPQRAFEERLVGATRERLVSDAPLGIFLSGGVDSALVAALAQREAGRALASFSVGFEDASYDERPKARRVAERIGTQHHEVLCRPQDVPDAFARLSASADHLLADQSMIPLALLAAEARESVKVVLTGDGGDELLAGYPTYRALRFARPWVRFAPRALRAALARVGARLPAGSNKMAPGMLLGRFLQATTDGIEAAHARWRAIRRPDEIDALVGAVGCGAPEWQDYAAGLALGGDWSLLQRAVHADVRTWLADSILAKVDRATMAVGLEARSPLLDVGLFELCFATLLADPANAGKRPLRRFAGTLLGPEFAATPKEGFQTPWSRWLAGPLRPWVRASLTDVAERLPGVLDAASLKRVEEEHASGARDHGLALYGLVALAEWSKLFSGLALADEAE
jgi:asparagine synthase (glutamine-hydrolysing)